jgi:hypothetical protein
MSSCTLIKSSVENSGSYLMGRGGAQCPDEVV